jgi:hypothetical protein
MGVVEVLIGLAVIVYLIGSRMRGQLANSRKLLVLPAVLGIAGVESLAHAAVRPSAGGVALLVFAGLVAAIFGLIRGATVQLREVDGMLWYRYRVLTVVLWCCSFAVDGALHFAAGAMHQSAVSNAMLAIAGVTFGAEAAMVYLRAHLNGLPLPATTRGGGQRAGRGRGRLLDTGRR